MARRNRARYLAGASFLALSLTMGTQAGAALQDAAPDGEKRGASKGLVKENKQPLPAVAPFRDLLTVAESAPTLEGVIAQSVDSLKVETLAVAPLPSLAAAPRVAANYNDATVANLIVNAPPGKSDPVGIDARNSGGGYLQINSQGVTGTAGDGIYAINYAPGTALTIDNTGYNVTGATSGITALTFSSEIRGGAQQEFALDDRTVGVSNPLLGTAAVQGADDDETQLTLGAGMSLEVSDSAVLFMGYDAEIGGDQRSHMVNLGVRFSW